MSERKPIDIANVKEAESTASYSKSLTAIVVYAYLMHASDWVVDVIEAGANDGQLDWKSVLFIGGSSFFMYSALQVTKQDAERRDLLREKWLNEAEMRSL